HEHGVPRDGDDVLAGEGGAGEASMTSSRLVLRTRLCDLLGIDYPVLQSGMGLIAGPDLVAAVSGAHALGIVAGFMLGADPLRAAIRLDATRGYYATALARATVDPAVQSCRFRGIISSPATRRRDVTGEAECVGLACPSAKPAGERQCLSRVLGGLVDPPGREVGGPRVQKDVRRQDVMLA